MLALDFGELGRLDPDRQRVSRVNLDIWLADMRHQPRGLSAASHRVPLVADAPRIEYQRIARACPRRGAAKRRRDKTRLAVRMVETALGEKARVLRGASIGARPLERLQRRVVRRRDAAEDADVEIAPSVVFAGGEPGVFGEDLCGLFIGEGLGVAHPARDLAHLPPVGHRFARRHQESPLARDAPLRIGDASFFLAPGGARQQHVGETLVSVEQATSDTTTNGQLRTASRTRSASGMLSAGLVPIIQSALIRPSSTARNMSTALRPGLAAIVGEPQKSRTMRR